MKFFYKVTIISVTYFIAFTSLKCESENNKTIYDVDWLYLLDDNGTNFVLNYSMAIEDTSHLISGEAYFYLYTRANEDKPEKLIISILNELIESQYFNRSNDIRVITHGWRSKETVDWIQNVKHSLLREHDLNVITVDWYELARSDIYPLAAISTRYVGSQVATLLDALALTYNVTGKSIYLIGHSLGAHVMGYAGMLSKEKIVRITGLDPARPLFEVPEMPPDFRLDKSDAEFVDIIHTCGGIYGYRKSYGHVDFYPNNGGAIQPGCDGPKRVIDACSHSRSHQYFEESIEYKKTNTGFVAYACDNWETFNKGECKNNPTTSMGYYARPEIHGNYYLRTRNESKYAE